MQKTLSLWMLIAFFFAIPFAFIFPDYAIQYKFLGSYFISILKNFVPFLIFGTITYSVASFGSNASATRIVPLTLGLYLLTTLISITYALLIGSNIEFNTGEIIQLTSEPLSTTQVDLGSTLSVLAIDFKNIFNLILQGNPIAIMLLSILLGIAIRFSGPYETKLVSIFSYFNDLVLKTTNI